MVRPGRGCMPDLHWGVGHRAGQTKVVSAIFMLQPWAACHCPSAADRSFNESPHFPRWLSGFTLAGASSIPAVAPKCAEEERAKALVFVSVCSSCPPPVLQIGDVRLINGRFECKPSLTTSSPSQLPLQAGASGSAKAAGGAGAPGEVPFDIHQQMAQLAILMVSDLGTMKGHLYKV